MTSVINSTLEDTLVSTTTYSYTFEHRAIPVELICLITTRTFFGLIGILLNLSLVNLIAKNKNLPYKETLSCMPFSCIQSFFSSDLCLKEVCLRISNSMPSSRGTFCPGPVSETGVDRMLCCTFPCWYNKGSKLYVACVISICFGYGLFSVFTCFRAVTKMQNIQVMCSVSELYVPEISTEIFSNNVVLNGLTLCTYVVVWIVFTNKKATKNDKVTRRMLKSLTVVMAFVFLGWNLYSTARLLISVFALSALTTWYVSTAIGVILSIVAGSNAVVLYIFSKEYRKLFQIQNQRLAFALGLSRRKVEIKKFSIVNVAMVSPIAKSLGRRPV